MEFGMQHSSSFTGASQQPVEWYNSGGNYNTAAYNYAPPPSQTTASYGGAHGFEDEPPLLEELGIDMGAILGRTKAILLHQMKDPCLQDLDMGGALMFLLMLSGLHLLMAKVHFGIVLGWSVVQSIVLYFVVNQIASNGTSEHRPLDLYSCCCITGYGMLPIILFSVGVLLIPKGPIYVVIGVIAAAWSAITAAGVLSKVSPALQDVQTLLIYPCFLMYSSFALLTVY